MEFVLVDTRLSTTTVAYINGTNPSSRVSFVCDKNAYAIMDHGPQVLPCMYRISSIIHRGNYVFTVRFISKVQLLLEGGY